MINIALISGTLYSKHWPVAVRVYVAGPSGKNPTTNLRLDSQTDLCEAGSPARQARSRLHAWAEYFTGACLSAAVPACGVSVGSTAAAVTAAFVPPALGTFAAVLMGTAAVGGCGIGAYHAVAFWAAYAYGLGAAAGLGVLASVAFGLSPGPPGLVAIVCAGLSTACVGLAMTTAASLGLALGVNAKPLQSSSAV